MTARVRIEGRDLSRVIECDEAMPVLHAGLAAGVPLPYECATGTCGTCKAEVTEGEVEQGWPEAPGLAHVRGGRGVLLCQCRPSGDCAFRVAAAIADRPDPAPRPRRFRGRITECNPLTHDVMEIGVELDRPMRFLGGQFVLLRWPGIDGYRAYSMIGAPGETRRLGFVIKNKAGGRVSERLFGESPSTAPVDMFGPLGRAYFDPEAAGDLVLLAGGSGLGPILSILRAAAAAGALDARNTQVIFGVRTERDLFCLDALRALQEGREAVMSVTVALSEHGEMSNGAVPASFAVTQGMVHEVLERGLHKPLSGCQAFLAGPPPMVDASLRVLLLKGRLPPTRIKYDKYS